MRKSNKVVGPEEIHLSAYFEIGCSPAQKKAFENRSFRALSLWARKRIKKLRSKGTYPVVPVG
jgi:hypothetical protein